MVSRVNYLGRSAIPAGMGACLGASDRAGFFDITLYMANP